MADNFRYAQLQSYNLNGSGGIIGDTTLVLKSMKDIDGNTITMAATFGTIGFGTIEPDSGTAEEQISFTGLTNNANGTTTLTGVKSVTMLYPYTATVGLAKTHAGSTVFTISNTSGYYDQFTAKDNDEIITGNWTFNNFPVTPATPLATDLAPGMSRLSLAAANPLDPIVVGDNDTRFVNIPTTGEKAALPGNNTDIAVGSGNKYVTQTGLQHNAEKYAADAGANDTYVITLSPVPTSYTNGMVVYFKANTINTGAATLNVNSLGAKTIVKGVNTALIDGDIAAGQFVTVIYDGTNFVLQNPTNNSANILYTNGVSTYNVSASGTLNMAHGLGRLPLKVKLKLALSSGAAATIATISTLDIAYNGTTQSNIATLMQSSSLANGNYATTDALARITTDPVWGNYITATVTWDITNIIITFVLTNALVGTADIMFEAQ